MRDKKLIERRQEIRQGINALEVKNAEWHMKYMCLMLMCGVSYFDSTEDIVKAIEAHKTNEGLKPLYKEVESIGKEIRAIKQAINKLI